MFSRLGAPRLPVPALLWERLLPRQAPRDKLGTGGILSSAERAAAIENVGAVGSRRQGRIVAPSIVSSEARPCSGGRTQFGMPYLSAQEGRGSGCALPRRPPCLPVPALLWERLLPRQARDPELRRRAAAIKRFAAGRSAPEGLRDKSAKSHSRAIDRGE